MVNTECLCTIGLDLNHPSPCVICNALRTRLQKNYSCQQKSDNILLSTYIYTTLILSLTNPIMSLSSDKD